MIDKTSCWYNIDAKICLEKMGAGLRGPYKKTSEFLLSRMVVGEKTVVELGCGSGRAIMLFEGYEYTGVDLSVSIETIGKIANPNLNFIKRDIIEDDIFFISEYEVVYMDAFIDVMQYPLTVLNKILQNSSKYIVLIRQEIIDDDTIVVKNPSYNGFTYHSKIGKYDFSKVLAENRFIVVEDVDACVGIDGWRSFLLCKR